ncbi:MAG: hypothetical protein IJN43_18880 [Ruminococcus sp.]|nr:hypothetical protein [Ruminococcus sp.]
MDFKSLRTWLLIAAMFTIVAVCCVVEPTLILLLGGAGYGVYKLYEYNRQQEQMNQLQADYAKNQAVENVHRAALRVLQRLSKPLDIIRPEAIADVRCKESIVSKQGFSLVRSHVKLNPSNAKDISKIPQYIRLIQTTIDDLAVSGDFDDLFPVQFVNEKDTVLAVDSISFDESHLVIDFAIRDCQAICDYLNKKKAIAEKPNRISRDDEEF